MLAFRQVKNRLTRRSASNLERFGSFGREDFFRREEPPRQALGVVIFEHPADRVTVGPDTIRPEIASHQPLRPGDVLRQPWQHHFQRGGLVQIGVGQTLRLGERLEERLRDKAMRVVHVAANRMIGKIRVRS
jgi:hypothetical protein